MKASYSYVLLAGLLSTSAFAAVDTKALVQEYATLPASVKFAKQAESLVGKTYDCAWTSIGEDGAQDGSAEIEFKEVRNDGILYTRLSGASFYAFEIGCDLFTQTVLPYAYRDGRGKLVLKDVGGAWPIGRGVCGKVTFRATPDLKRIVAIATKDDQVADTSVTVDNIASTLAAAVACDLK